jgi:hypothetical protein
MQDAARKTQYDPFILAELEQAGTAIGAGFLARIIQAHAGPALHEKEILVMVTVQMHSPEDA